MNTVTISFNSTEEALVFTGVTLFKYDPSNGQISIVHEFGTFDGQPENVAVIEVK